MHIKKCIFCDKQITTNNYSQEHVIKRSILKTLGLKKHPILFMNINPKGELISKPRNPIADQIKLGMVCESCNNGWIRKQDEEIEAKIIELANGKNPNLTTNDSFKIARWVFRTAISLRHWSTDQTLFIPRRVRLRMRSDSTYLPSGLAVFYFSSKNLQFERRIDCSSHAVWKFSKANYKLMKLMSDKNTYNLKFAIKIDQIIFICVLTSLNKPHFTYPFSYTKLFSKECIASPAFETLPYEWPASLENSPVNISQYLIELKSAKGRKGNTPWY